MTEVLNRKKRSMRQRRKAQNEWNQDRVEICVDAECGTRDADWFKALKRLP